MEKEETTNEKIRKLAEASPDLADVLKSKFPEAFEDEYVKFGEQYFKGIYGLVTLVNSAEEAGVNQGEGIYVESSVEVIVKPIKYGATAVLFKIKK